MKSSHDLRHGLKVDACMNELVYEHHISFMTSTWDKPTTGLRFRRRLKTCGHHGFRVQVVRPRTPQTDVYWTYLLLTTSGPTVGAARSYETRCKRFKMPARIESSHYMNINQRRAGRTANRPSHKLCEGFVRPENWPPWLVERLRLAGMGFQS